jgi:alkylhydroperoxidase family enzyme
MHARERKRAGQSDERIFAVAAWRDTPWFSEAERAALALAEAVTRLADRPDPVPDAVWNEAAKRYTTGARRAPGADRGDQCPEPAQRGCSSGGGRLGLSGAVMWRTGGG